MSREGMAVQTGFWKHCLKEPFRVFFPLGTLFGISGVSLWPLYFTGMHKFYPGIMHARLMIEGFLAGFILGFLGTALPRLLGAPALRRGELGLSLGLFLLTAGLHIGEQPRLGDLAFTGLMLVFGGCMIPRVRQRTDAPPPGFVLVALGYSSGVAGPILWLCGMQGWIPGELAVLGGMLLNQAFPLFPILGVGAFLLPRFLGIPNDAPESRGAGWAAAAAAGVALLASYGWEAYTPLSQLPVWLRGLATATYLAGIIPFHRQVRPASTIALTVQVALAALLAGLLFPLLWPTQRLAGLHVIFLGGFSLLVFPVATRVILGHSGNARLFAARLPGLRVAAGLVLMATVLRAVGDFLPTRPHWLSGASYLWMIAAAVWGGTILPKVRVADPEES